jgi:hypothetical protein
LDSIRRSFLFVLFALRVIQKMIRAQDSGRKLRARAEAKIG